MSKRFLLALSLIALGLIIGAYLRGGPSTQPPIAEPAYDVVVGSRLSPPGKRDPQQELTQLRQQVQALRATLEVEVAERRRLSERLDELSEQLAAAPAGGVARPESAPDEPDSDERHAAAGPAPAPPDEPPSDGGPNVAPNFTERALIAAGVEPDEAARIKRQEDELTMARMYLRDQAGREGWADSPRFAEEMAEIEHGRTSIRDEIGDEAYDRYLSASGQTNRVTVNEVLSDSPAAQAGLQSGDVVLRYADQRIFAPNELVSGTRGGEVGETVRLEVLRQGERFEIDVPRGPLGIRIAASQGQPGDG